MTFISKIIYIERWLLCCLFFFVTGCANNKNNESIAHALKDSTQQEQNITEAIDTIYAARNYVKQGDIILRSGKDFTSDIMRNLSVSDKTYSHCGIASFENDTLFVYHAIGGEWNPDQKLRRDPFEYFCNPYESKGFGIYRYGLNKNEKDNLSKIIQTFYHQGIAFDMQFDLNTDNKMYCSEFVYKSIEQATIYKKIIPTTTFNNIKFVAIDNLYKNPFCHEVKRFSFKQH